MIRANFNAYSTYVTDSLYQWDLNQVLSVSGLNLSVAPEVHFSNANMDKAIVRQATLIDHIVSVAIPNSLLQDPLTINAHIGIYEGDTFKVVELVSIPVIARKRPADYQIEDSDEEIYSFKRLENMINNINDDWIAASEAQIVARVTSWLDEHPEATTTVQDQSITVDKLSRDLQSKIVNDKYGCAVGEESFAIFECVRTWIKNNDKLYYANIGNPNSFNRVDGVNSLVTEIRTDSLSINGKYPLDCMSFVMMCLMGIGFEQSIFGDKSNKSYYPRSTLDFLSDPFCEYVTRGSDGITRDFADNFSWNRVLSWQFAEFLNDRGLYYHINDGDQLKGLQCGDIIFLKSDSENYAKRFDKIVHCAIYVGNSRFGTPLIIDCTSENPDYPVRARWISKSYSENIVGYARIALNGQINNKSSNILQNKSIFARESYRYGLINRPLSPWDIYKVTLSVCYNNETAKNNNFPAIKIEPQDYVFSRFNSDNMPNFVVGEWKTVDMFVCLSPEMVVMPDKTPQYLYASFYPSLSSSSDAYINIESIEPVLVMSRNISKGCWIADSYVFDSYADSLNTLSNLLFNKLGTGGSVKSSFRITLSGAVTTVYVHLLRLSSTRYFLAVWGSGGKGAVRECINGTITDKTYTNENPVPFYYQI